jgi:phage shock protein A
MNDLLKKLNVLVKAGINDVLGEVRSGELPRKALSVFQLGSDIDREVNMLRGRINEALAYEDELQARLTALQTEVNDWDAKADSAVAAGDDVNGRYFIDQMHRAQQRVAMAEADLRDHQQVTQELISRVNMLESAVADARRAEEEKQAEAQKQAQAQKEAEAASVPEQAESVESAPRGQVLSDVLRDVRERVNQMGDLIAAKEEVQQATEPQSAPADEQVVDDDLEARRQRLSKPK